MKKIFLTVLMTIISSMAFSQSKITLSVGDESMTASLVDNDATRELLALLEDGPITIQMSDYGGFEKVGELPQSFTTSDTRITTVAGDIMLYQGHNMVIFYGSNTWSYTRLGKIDGATSETLRQFLGDGVISLTISLDLSSVDMISADKCDNTTIYDLNGNRVIKDPLPSGIYIINGKKTLIRK